MDGILNVLKPPGMSSHDVVNIIRKKFNIKKVGHTGTLDPNAAGVLPICIGRATKISNYLLEDTKSYRAELTLGVTTDTQDMYGTIIKEHTVELTESEIRRAILSFIGEYYQVPPMFSALKVKGKKLYDYAREGIELEREPRRINIYSITIIYVKKNKVLFDVVCSKGTYIRTLCHDIGLKLGCGGVMSFLIRTNSGAFSIDDSISIDSIKEHKNPEELLKPIDYPLSHLPKVQIHESKSKWALNGNKIDSHFIVNWVELPVNTIVRAYVGNQLIGLGKIDNNNIDTNTHIKFTRLLI